MKANLGRIVWHDLMTNDVEGAMSFYSELLGWEYQIEHAENSVWKSGEGEYPLIIVGGEAHGGFVDPGGETESHWVAYVTVKDVDAVSNQATVLGGAIEKKPFNVPGVGRSAVIIDPKGAVICPFKQAHSMPSPAGTFLWDELITEDIESEKQFYESLFGWQTKDIDTPGMGVYTVFKSRDDQESVAGSFNHAFAQGELSFWLPYLMSEDTDTSVTKSLSLGAELLFGVKEVPDEGRFAVLKDPGGAKFGLFTPFKV